jgi:hypothetical protein
MSSVSNLIRGARFPLLFSYFLQGSVHEGTPNILIGPAFDCDELP